MTSNIRNETIKRMVESYLIENDVFCVYMVGYDPLRPSATHDTYLYL